MQVYEFTSRIFFLIKILPEQVKVEAERRQKIANQLKNTWDGQLFLIVYRERERVRSQLSKMYYRPHF